MSATEEVVQNSYIISKVCTLFYGKGKPLVFHKLLHSTDNLVVIMPKICKNFIQIQPYIFFQISTYLVQFSHVLQPNMVIFRLTAIKRKTNTLR
jgi:hypothetical protein